MRAGKEGFRCTFSLALLIAAFLSRQGHGADMQPDVKEPLADLIALRLTGRVPFQVFPEIAESVGAFLIMPIPELVSMHRILSQAGQADIAVQSALFMQGRN